MPEPDPDDIQHEVEMGAEEVFGQALSGRAERRVTSIEKRIEYLLGQIKVADNGDELRRLRDELREAEVQRSKSKAQQAGLN